MQNKHIIEKNLKTINGQSILGEGNIEIVSEAVVDQNIDASTLTPEQLDYLRDKQIKYGHWEVERVAINLIANQTKLPMFYAKYTGNLEPIDKYSFLCKAGKTYEVSYGIVAGMSAVGQYNFAIYNNITNSMFGDTTIGGYAGPTAGTQYRINMGTNIFKFDIDTPISIRPYVASGNVTTMYGSNVLIKEISSFDVSLKNFKINGKSFDENNNIDLEGLSTLSSPKIGVEVLTEERHPVSGKPIYMQGFDFGALPNNTTKSVLHNIDYEWMAIDYGSSYTYNAVARLISSVMNGNYSRMYVNNQYVECISTANVSSSAAILVLLYTKTTDTTESPVRLIGGGFKFIESDVEPENPSLGDEWHNTTNDILYKRRKKNGILGWYEI